MKTSLKDVMEGYQLVQPPWHVWIRILYGTGGRYRRTDRLLGVEVSEKAREFDHVVDMTVIRQELSTHMSAKMRRFVHECVGKKKRQSERHSIRKRPVGTLASCQKTSRHSLATL